MDLRDYLIATSSTSDLPRTYLDAHGIPFISYSFTMDGKPCTDDCREETRAEIYRKMREGALLKTSMISETAYADFFDSLLRTGQDAVYLDMSEKMSASYANAAAAAETIRKRYPEQRLVVVDTRCISGGLGLLVKHLVRMKEGGATLDEAVAWADANKLRIAHRFTVDNLKYLKAGGRVSNASALVGILLAIKPVLYVPDEGTLDVAQKVRGRKSALSAILRAVLSDLSQTDATGIEIDILNADCLQDAEYIRDEIRKVHPEVGEICITSLGVVIGAHCGPGLLTVFYLCNGRVPQ